MTRYRSTRGGFEYTVTRKRVKNINLRVREDGRVTVSAPFHTPESVIIFFVEEKSSKISDILLGLPEPAPQKKYTKEEKALFLEKAEKVCRGIEHLFFSGEYIKPRIELCFGKSRWGYCIPSKNLVRLNISLSDFPHEALEYVAMHEYCHFLCPSHSDAFYFELSSRMPNWRERRALLGVKDPKNRPKN